MKRSAVYGMQPNPKGPQPPKRTLAELADEFDVTPASLRAYLARYKLSAPRPSQAHPGSPMYYVHAEARRWWKELQDEKNR